MANDAKKVSELAVTTTLSANDRVVILSNPSSAANTKTITAANFANSLISSNIIPTASNTQLGVVKVDGTTITISNGVISGAANTGNIRFTNNTITSVITGDISISPNTSGSLSVPSLKIPVGSLIQNTISISTVVNNAILLTVNSYSTNSTAIPAGTIGNANTIPAPWAIYQLTATPTPILQINDIVGGAGVPANSAIQYVGSSPYGAYFVTNTTFSSSPAANGITLTFARPVVNPSLQISTANSTDIALIAGANGHVAVNSDIIPVTTNEFRLGTPANRFKELWLGAGTLYVLDETLGVDQAIGANAGNFYIKGGAGISVGEFTLRDNTIQIANTARDIFIGANLATGNVVFNRPIAVKSYDTGNVTFAVARNGRVQTFSPSIPAGDVGAFSIIGSSDGSYQGVTNPGGMLHITGNDGVGTRLTIDSFGDGNTAVPIIAGRAARGTANTPTNTQANDILIRIAARGWTGANNFNIPSQTITPTLIEAQASENFTNTAIGTRWNFYNAPPGSVAKVLSASISSYGLTTNTVTFSDSTTQNTAFSASSAVTKINVGTGLTQSGNVGIVGIDATGVLTVSGTANQVIVANVGQNVTLSLPQSIGTTSNVQFSTLTVQNLVVTGNSTVANSASVANAVIQLAYNSTNSAQIDSGGFTLGNTASAYYVSFLYNLSNNAWTTGNTNFITKNITANAITASNGYFTAQVHAGAAYVDYDFPNATIQADSNVNSYNQIVEKNHNGGTQASADFVAVNDIGTDSANYVDLGINSSTYANNDYSITGPNDAYLYINGGDLAIGAQTASKGLKFFAGGTTANNKIGSANASGWFIDNLTVTNTIIGTANNVAFVGTVAAANVVSNAQLSANLANYQTTAGLSANVALLTANAAGYLGNSSGTLANITSWISGNAATAYSNAVSSFSGAYQTTAGLAANVATLTANNTSFVGSISAANVVSNGQLQSNLASYQTLVGLAANVVTLTSNSANFIGILPASNVVSSAQLSGNLANYVSSTQLSGNLANYQTTAGLSANVALLTANSASYIGTLSAANVVSNAQLTANLAFYVTGANFTANLANYQTTAGLSANVAVLTSNAAGYLGNSSGTIANIASWVSGNAATAYSNAVANAAALYQTTAGLSANVLTLSSNNASYLDGVAANAYVNTSGSYTVTGVHTHNANVVIGSNAGIVANGSVGLAGQYLTSNGSSAYWSNNVPKMLVYSINLNRSLSTANTPQSLFGVGVTLNSDTRYRYKIYGTVFKSNTSSSSSGALRFAITNSTANAVIGHNYYLSNPCAANNSQSSLVTAFQVSQSVNTGFSTMTTITNSNTGATWYSFVIDGTLDINTGGTLNPQISFTHSNGTLGTATVLQQGATIEFWPIGNASSNTVIGNWA